MALAESKLAQELAKSGKSRTSTQGVRGLERRCPTSGNSSLLTSAARSACGPFFKGELRCSEQKCVARQMCNEFAALPSSSLFPAGIKHGLIEPAPHQRERYELILVTNRVFDLIDQEKDMAVLVTSADGGNDVV
jgi:hypothetical protein